MHKPQPNPIVLFLFGLWILWGFGYETVWFRLMTHVEGTVVSAHDILLAPARHGTEYVFRTGEGRDISYLAGATDASLSRHIPVGSYVRKLRWHLCYGVDGQTINDFSVPFYAVMLSVAVGILVWAINLHRQETA